MPRRETHATKTHWLIRCVRVALIALTLAGAFATQAHARNKGGFIVYEVESGRVLRAVRSRARLHPASLTKMMTLYLVFEAVEQRKITLHQRMKISRHAASMPAMELGVRRGDVITVRDAVRAAAVHSANDAAVALAELVGGTEKNFARMMTAKARELGMLETTFKNATGFTRKGHLSTPRDMAILAQRLFQDFPQHYAVFSKRSVNVQGRRYRATNSLLGAPGVDGIKTGYTRAAGYNLVASAERRRRRITVVLMGGRTKDRRNKAVAELLDDGFKRLKKIRPNAPGPRLRPKPRAKETELARSAPTPRPRPETARPGNLQMTAMAARRSRYEAMVGKRWAIQLGSFFKREEAREMLQGIMRRRGPRIDTGYRAIVTGRIKNASGKSVTVHRVRFTGMDEGSARAACRALEARKRPCALVPPEGWGG